MLVGETIKGLSQLNIFERKNIYLKEQNILHFSSSTPLFLA